MLAKTKLNAMEVLISKALIDASVSNDEFASVIYVLKEYNDLNNNNKEANKNNKSIKIDSK